MEYSEHDLTEAARALTSSINKCEKARPKLKEGTAGRTWVDRQLAAFSLGVDLIVARLAALSCQSPDSSPEPTNPEQKARTGATAPLHQIERSPDSAQRAPREAGTVPVDSLSTAHGTYCLLADKCETLVHRFAEGTPQKTLAVRRLQAFKIVISLIEEHEEERQ